MATSSSSAPILFPIIIAAATPKPVQITINILFNVFAICIVATALVPINEYDTV